jgi:hypothetical protein
LDHREAHDQSTTDAPDVADFVTDDLSEFLARLNVQLSIRPNRGKALGADQLPG